MVSQSMDRISSLQLPNISITTLMCVLLPILQDKEKQLLIYRCFVSIYVSVSLYLSVHPSVCLSIYLSIYLSACLSVCLSICPSVHLSICSSICLFIYQPDCLRDSWFINTCITASIPISRPIIDCFCQALLLSLSV